MELLSCNWIEFGNLAIGIGTFVLAIVLGFITISSTKKDRKVHIADKRQQWIDNFRKLISSILATQQQFNLTIHDCSVEELDEMHRILNLASNEIQFMFAPNNPNRNILENLFHETYKDLRLRKADKLAENQTKIIQIVDRILIEQRQKIANLDNNDLLI